MITLEVNGQKHEVETEKEAKKMLAKMMRQERKEAAERNIRYATARTKAQSEAYRVLCWKLAGCLSRNCWRFYAPGAEYAEHLFRPLANTDMGGRITKHIAFCQDGKVTLDHYGNDVVGAVCDGGGFCWLVFLRDRSTDITTCYAIGVEGDTYSLADCPTLTPADFTA